MQSDRLVVVGVDSTYRILLKQLLGQAGYLVVGESDSLTGALRLIRSREPDLVLVDGETPQINTLELLHVMESSRIAPVVVLTSEIQRALVEKAKESGYLSFVAKPFSGPVLLSAIELALANYRRFFKLEQEVEKLKNTLESRKIVEKAKGILMKELGITEAEAYQRIRKKSMDKCLPMHEVAAKIILVYE